MFGRCAHVLSSLDRCCFVLFYFDKKRECYVRKSYHATVRHAALCVCVILLYMPPPCARSAHCARGACQAAAGLGSGQSGQLVSGAGAENTALKRTGRLCVPGELTEDRRRTDGDGRRTDATHALMIELASDSPFVLHVLFHLFYGV